MSCLTRLSDMVEEVINEFYEQLGQYGQSQVAPINFLIGAIADVNNISLEEIYSPSSEWTHVLTTMSNEIYDIFIENMREYYNCDVESDDTDSWILDRKFKCDRKYAIPQNIIDLCQTYKQRFVVTAENCKELAGFFLYLEIIPKLEIMIYGDGRLVLNYFKLFEDYCDQVVIDTISPFFTIRYHSCDDTTSGQNSYYHISSRA